MASAIGTPLYADSMTENCSRLSYARICVEVDVDAQLPSAFDFQISPNKVVEIRVKYPWKPLRCSSCKVFGHATCTAGGGGGVSEKRQIGQKQVWVGKPTGVGV